MSPFPACPPLRILLVEDHEDTLRALTTLLERQGHQVTPTSSMSAALAASRLQRIDVLVSDLALPDGDGWQLMTQLRSEQSLPGVAMSGFASPGDLARSSAAGFVRHLVKPFDPELLRNVLREIARPRPHAS